MLVLIFISFVAFCVARNCEFTHVTRSGLKCSKWNIESTESRYRPTPFNHNQCAAADPRDPNPFCYTEHYRIRWEYCNCTITPQSAKPPVTKCSKTRNGYTPGYLIYSLQSSPELVYYYSRLLQSLQCRLSSTLVSQIKDVNDGIVIIRIIRYISLLKKIIIFA